MYYLPQDQQAVFILGTDDSAMNTYLSVLQMMKFELGQLHFYCKMVRKYQMCDFDYKSVVKLSIELNYHNT